MAHGEDSTDILPSLRQILWGERRGTSLSKGKVRIEYAIIWLPFIIGGVWSGVWAGRRVYSLADI